jgi:hypothetical protein
MATGKHRLRTPSDLTEGIKYQMKKDIERMKIQGLKNSAINNYVLKKYNVQFK